MVAHDLRNPFNQILGYAEMLASYEEAMLPEEHRDSLRTIVRVADKMSRILDELLHLAEIRQKDIRAETLDMGQIVAEAWERLSFMTAEYQAELKYVSRLPAARGYGPWIEEVWVNYLSNACKYGGQPPRLEVGGEMLANGMARFWVRDNGDGIPPDKQEQLFRPFTRLDQVRARGHGLGLSIVRRVVEKTRRAGGRRKRRIARQRQHLLFHAASGRMKNNTVGGVVCAEPPKGVEPLTWRLRNVCSAD